VPQDTPTLLNEIRSAIAKELKLAAHGESFVATRVDPEGPFLWIYVETPEDSTRPAMVSDEFEDCIVSWEGGSGEVISVEAQFSLIRVYLFSGVSIRPGSVLAIRSPEYLKSVQDLWADESLARRFVEPLLRDVNPREIQAISLDSAVFSRLRDAQRNAFRLVDWRRSFLWGPPGTGKTYTLARILAAHTLQRPGKILLLSSTNVAVDRAVIEVDRALAELSAPPKFTYRFGSRFNPKDFEGKEHLIPLSKDKKDLVQKLRRLYELKPAKDEVNGYKKWKDERDVLQRSIDDENAKFLSEAKIAGMTTTLAANKFRQLLALGFDLIVFDEASQIGQIQALTLGSLGKRVLFAGDHKQLSPIAQGKDDWLGKSPFEWIDKPSAKDATCQLVEQSRMCKCICNIVSERFYDGKLRVADREWADAKNEWKDERRAPSTPMFRARNLVTIEVDEEASQVKGFYGYQCLKSAELVAALVQHHWEKVWCKEVSPQDRTKKIEQEVLILTPYRAQRRLIEVELDGLKLSQKLVSTVHRAQGSEKNIVIFDPVRPQGKFVNSEEGRRLVNVAFSRAKQRLIVMLEIGWREHGDLRYIGELFGGQPNRFGIHDLISMKKEQMAPRTDPLKCLVKVSPKQAPTQTDLKDNREYKFADGLLAWMIETKPTASQLSSYARITAKAKRLDQKDRDNAVRTAKVAYFEKGYGLL